MAGGPTRPCTRVCLFVLSACLGWNHTGHQHGRGSGPANLHIGDHNPLEILVMPCKNPYLTRIWVCHQVKHADSLSNITQFPFMNHNTGLVLADWTAVMLATVYSRDATSVQATPLLFYTRADTPLSWLRAGWAAILIKPRDGDN